MENRPLSWQKLRHILGEAGILDQGWQIGSKRDSDMVAVIAYPGPRPPGKRRVEKLIKTLQSNGIAFREQDANHFMIPKGP
jgi:hypothetical protein